MVAVSAGVGPIGRSQPRFEDPRLLTGRGLFIGDVTPPRALHAAFVRSAHPHARLVWVDATRARAMAGVAAVLTAADLPPVNLSSARHPDLLLTPQPPLATDKARFVGEPVAVVLAESRYLAEDAADLVDVQYEVLTPALHAAAEVPIFEHIPDDVVFRDRQEYGELGSAFERATTVVSNQLRFPRQLACPLEPRGCVADFDLVARQLTVWSSTQAPHRLRRELAGLTGLAEQQVRVVMHDIGGAFGQKIPTQLEDVAVVLAAMTVGRPVKWIEDRRENLTAAPHSRDQHLHVELALDREYRFIGLRVRIVGDAGAYSFNSGSCLTEAYRAARSLPGPYRIQNYRYDVTIRLSNKSPVAPYRGVGFVAAQCARELVIDEAARVLRVDRFALRERNLVAEADLPYTTSTGWVLRDVSVTESLARARTQLTGEDRPAADARLLRGIGISPYVEPSGIGVEGSRQVHGFVAPSRDSARVIMHPSGTATVVVGTPSLGQGLETTMAQVAAHELGIDPADVVVRWTDTSQAPLSLTGSRASRAAVASGGAVGQAAAQVKRQLLQVAAEMLEANAADLDIRDGAVWVVGEPAARLSVAAVASAGHDRTDLFSRGVQPAFEAVELYIPDASYSNGCVLAVVDVDPDTGAVAVRRLIGVEDCGTVINPMIVEGQFVGAVAQGIGAALLEQFSYSDDGQPMISTLMDYLQPTASDLVRVELSHIATPSTATWAGIKGMGESGAIGTVAAIATAVADAIAVRGGRVTELPLLPSTVWNLLHRAAPAPAG